MLVALLALTGFLFIQFFAVNLPMLLVGYLLLGFPWGCFQTLTVSYAAEVMPVRLRQVRRHVVWRRKYLLALIPLPFLTVSHDLCQSLLVSVARGWGTSS